MWDFGWEGEKSDRNAATLSRAGCLDGSADIQKKRDTKKMLKNKIKMLKNKANSATVFMSVNS